MSTLRDNIWAAQNRLLKKWIRAYGKWLDNEYSDLELIDRSIWMGEYKSAISKLSLNELRKLNNKNFKDVAKSCKNAPWY